jgi:hypothetical protein
MAKEKQANPVGKTPEQRKTERAEAFKKLATRRVNKAIKMLSNIGNLSSYKPPQAAVVAIEGALTKAHNECMARLKGGNQSEGGFSL